MQILMANMGRMVIIMAISLCMYNCIDPFIIEADVFESSVVIEGTLTDQNETQKILVSRTFPLDTVLMSGISGAKVSVLDSNGGSQEFSQEEVGVYLSNDPFAAVSGLTYTLRVETPDGKVYVSDETQVPATTTLDNLYAERGIKDDDEDGMFIYVDSYDPTGQSKYYRYQYEETYKIVAPYWSPADLKVVSGLPNPEFEIVPREQEEQICYNTLTSNGIIIESTTDYNEDRVSKFPVRFIERNNYILANRYSILVRQYVQTRAAYTYFETLESLSGSESLFSQLQTGFLEGNVHSQSDSGENVIGFFQVSTVSEKRLFFNFEDFFPGESQPDYLTDCVLVAPPIIDEAGGSPLLAAMEFDLIRYYEDYDTANNPLNLSAYGPYLMVPRACGDCTAVGSNVVPDFWTED